MNTLAIALSDERLLKLQKLANDLNVSIEELVLIGIENLLAQPEILSLNICQPQIFAKGDMTLQNSG
jgi:hypothetical protein